MREEERERRREGGEEGLKCVEPLKLLFARRREGGREGGGKSLFYLICSRLKREK